MEEMLKQLMEMMQKNQEDMKTILKNSHKDMKTILKNSHINENFVQFSTSGAINVDDSGTSFSQIQTPTFDEITYGGKTEEEVTILGKQKIDCGRHIQDQEEELEELAGQVQPLEQARPRLEMTLGSMRKEAKQKAQMRDKELEDVQCNAQKKVKALEAQLNYAHEERTLLLRDNHELGKRLLAAAEPEHDDRVDDEVLLQGLKRTKALLRDAQTQFNRNKKRTPGKAARWQLRDQLEDVKCAQTVTFKVKQSQERGLLRMQPILQDAGYGQKQLAKMLKKFKDTGQQTSLVSKLQTGKNQLREQLAELMSKESKGDASLNWQVRRAELKMKKLEFKRGKQTTRAKLTVKEQQGQDQSRKPQRSRKGLYMIVTRLNVVYRIPKSPRVKMKVLRLNRLTPFQRPTEGVT